MSDESRETREPRKALERAARTRHYAHGKANAAWAMYADRLVPSPRLHRFAVAAAKEFDAADRVYFAAQDALLAAIAAPFVRSGVGDDQ